MPNGHDRDWVRFCLTVGGFRAKHGSWPTRMRLDQRYIDEFRESLLSPPDFEKLKKKVRLIPEAGTSLVAEDDEGRSYSHGAAGGDDRRAEIDAEEWLGVEALPEVW
jgi:hypothetical protein